LRQFESIIQKVQELGFTAYEAMAYVSLLEQNPVTRYELAKNSGVPRSAIYNVVHKLEQIGAVNARSSEPEKYVPLPPSQLFELLERQFHSRIERAKLGLKDFDFNMIPDYSWNIIGYDNMIIKVKELIQKAHNSIYLSTWHSEFVYLERDLLKAVKKGLQVVLYSFTEIKLPGAEVFSYGLNETELEKIWGHKIILISDKKDLLMGEADKIQKKKTVWTSNRALIDIALSHIILDITIYGIRLHKNVADTVNNIQNGETDYLGELLSEKFPEISV
jgi:sugar-specific transcriptional regulator TrmB